MWFFNAPQVVFGEDALEYLEELEGERAFIVTDPVLHDLGFSDRIERHLSRAGITCSVFAEVEPEPSLQTVQRGAKLLADFAPDWIVGLGGGSAMDASKAMWALAERPDLEPESISPVQPLGIGKMKLIAVPTTSGTGSEATWMLVLTDTETKRKVSLGSRELMPTIAIVDPVLTANLPPQIAADTGIDALTHAIEGYTSNWRSDFTDGLCLKAAELVFANLTDAMAGDSEAREHMANAATIAGMGFGNSMVALAHAMGHTFGAQFKVPHGRAVGLFLPYTMEFTRNGGMGRYSDIARWVGFTDSRDEAEGATLLIEQVRALASEVDHPGTIANLGIERSALDEAMDTMVANAETDNGIIAAPRMPETEELRRLFDYAFDGRSVDF